jgi:hypothetical protein
MILEKRNNAVTTYKKAQKDIRVLVKFIKIYCTVHHSQKVRSTFQVKGITGELLKDVSVQLCTDCIRLLIHGAGKRIICPYNPKPRCKKCPTYCYQDGYREKIKHVMRYSGIYLIKRGRLDLTIKYLF